MPRNGATRAVQHQVLEITARQAAGLGARETWQFRELLYFLVWRDLKVRYKQTTLGVLWAFIQPLGMMVVFTLFLGRFAGIPSDGLPYAPFVLAGLLPWQLFSQALEEAGNSLLVNERLITKIYFPRLVIPLATVLRGLVDFAIGLLILILVLAFYHVAPSSLLFIAPGFVAMTVAAAFGAGLWLAALNARYRDVRHTLPFLAQIWLVVTPVLYPASVIPMRWRWLYAVNPMSGAVQGFRWSVVGGSVPNWGPMAVSVISAVILLGSGLWFFRRAEASFADVI